MKTHKILFVDDDELILKGLSRVIDEYSAFWDTEYAKSGKQAIAMLQNSQFDAVITDMLMPVMDGLALLETVAETHPGVLRFVLSGNTNDIQAVKSASLVHQMFPKPSEMEFIFRIVEQACRLRDSLSDPKLVKVITSIKSLPSPPELYYQLVEELLTEEPNLRKVGEIVAKDTAMTAKMLQLVNSAFFGLADEINNPQRAVTLLGINTTKALLLSAHVFSEYGKKKSIPQTIKNLWNHSMMVSNIARKIALDFGLSVEEQENAQVAGILHDIGKLLQIKLPEFSKVLRFYSARLPLKIEYEYLSTSHAEMGAYLLGIWGIPDAIVEAVMYHHIPSKQLNTTKNALTAVHIANGLLNMHYFKELDKPEEHLDLLYLEQVIELTQLDEWIQYICEIIDKG
ncbi:MAG: HDOD domain-containing protein [Anaerolineaceae bacterium]|nr:HDOD domain-containing protein [Anaerolineaceae bacterium]